MAAEASKTMYEDQARTIATLAATNAELTVTVKKFTDKTITISEKFAAAAKSGSQRGGAQPGLSGDTSNTESVANSDEVFMPTKTNRKGMEFFVSQHKCGHCGKLAYYLPKFCPDNPQRKLELTERALAKAKAEASKWRCGPAGGSSVTNNFINICDEEPPGCTNHTLINVPPRSTVQRPSHV